MGDVGEWIQICELLTDAYTRNPDSVQDVLDTLCETRRYARLKKILSDDPPQQGDIFGMPGLPPEIKALEARAHEASPTLDAMIDFFRYWCTRSYDGYHEAVAVWVLSTIAARRVWLNWRKEGIWTPLYILLISDSTAHAKSEAAAYGEIILKACELGYLLVPDELSPQKLLSNMAGGQVPRNYAVKDDDGKEYIRLSKAFSGQRGWLYDEFGNELQEIMQAKGGYMALFYKLIKKLYDCKTSFTYDTYAHDELSIVMPSLSLIGTATPACLKPIASPYSAVWTDGMFARITFVVPPKNELKLQSAPLESCSVPWGTILHPLLTWHNRLGIPSCEIIDNRWREEMMQEAHGEDKKRKRENKPDFQVEKGDLPQSQVWMSDAVYQAHNAYYNALATLATNLDERFKSTYGRLPEKALRIAMLLASLEGCQTIDMRHWGRGQQSTEHWRRDFHEMIAQISSEDMSIRNYGDNEAQILHVLTKLKAGTHVTARFVSHQTAKLRKLGAPEVRKILDDLAESSDVNVIKEGTGKGALYGLK